MDEKELTPEIINALRSMELFQGKDQDELTEWMGKAPFGGGSECVLKTYPAGKAIVDEDSFGNCFYLLVSGEVSATKGPERRFLAAIGAGSFFGEIALVSGIPHSATITALKPCVVIEVPRRAFEEWMKKPGPFRNTIDRTYLERALANHLYMIPDFADVDARVLQEIARKLRLRIFSKDETIAREGDVADSMYIIREGYVRVVKGMAGGEQRTIAYLNDGHYFGENALLSGGRRQATVIAMGKVEAIQVMRDEFIALVNRDERMLDRFRDREARQSALQSGGTTELGFIGGIVAKGVIKATSALVIHLNACTRCGNCVKACAELHDGISRLTRHGMLFEAPAPKKESPLERLLVATSCMHCLDPECMIGCPTGAITRDVNGEVVITDACIGCGNCARRCPYGNISMADVKAEDELAKQKTGAPSIGGYFKLFRNTEKPPEGEPVALEKTEQKAVVRRIAVKCDLCQEYNHNHGCVYNCPYSAIERMDPREYVTQLQRSAT